MILKPRYNSINRIVVVLLTTAIVLQACQPGKLQQGTPATTPSAIFVTTQAPTTMDPVVPATATPTASATLPPPTQTPTPELSKELDQALISGVDWYVVVKSAQGQRLFGKNTEEIFQPASMIKIPLALVILKILEVRGDTVEDIHNYGIGRNFSDLLEAMVVRSEEAATITLETFARQYNRLRNYLYYWGLKHTTFDPRRSTVEDLLLSLELIDQQSLLTEELNDYLHELMSTQTENDQILLGVMSTQLPECVFYNKRGTLLNPTIVSDMGILKCGDQSWYVVVAGTPAFDSSTTFEDIQSSIEEFGMIFASHVLLQLNQN